MGTNEKIPSHRLSRGKRVTGHTLPPPFHGVCVPRFLFKNKTQRTSIKTALQMCVLSTTRTSDVTTRENKRKSRSEKQQKKTKKQNKGMLGVVPTTERRFFR